MARKLNSEPLTAGIGFSETVITTGEVVAVRNSTRIGIKGTLIKLEDGQEKDSAFFPRRVSELEKDALSGKQVTAVLSQKSVYHDVSTGGFTDFVGQITLESGRKIEVKVNLHKSTRRIL